MCRKDIKEISSNQSSKMGKFESKCRQAQKISSQNLEIFRFL